MQVAMGYFAFGRLIFPPLVTCFSKHIRESVLLDLETSNCEGRGVVGRCRLAVGRGLWRVVVLRAGGVGGEDRAGDLEEVEVDGGLVALEVRGAGRGRAVVLRAAGVVGWRAEERTAQI